MTQKVVLIFFICLLGAAGVSGAAGPTSEKQLPAVFDYLEEMVLTSQGNPDAKRLAPLLTFLNEKQTPGAVWEESRDTKVTGVGVFFSVPTTLSRFVQYMYDPELPVSAVVPGVVRLVREMKADGSCMESYAKLQLASSGLESPVVVRNEHTMEITPDGNSGAYYGYNQKELTFLSSWNGRRFLLTASRQTDPSNVGKKGYPLVTRDGGTIYCYSGETGLTKRGLGWVDSYIYTSFAITIYLEDAPGSGSLSAMSYKWLNAGWMGKNMVRPYHISQGIERFADHLNRFLMAPNTPEPTALVALNHRLDAESETALRTVLEGQLKALLDPSQKNASRMGRPYVEGLDHDELVAGILSNHVASLIAGGDSTLLNRLMATVGSASEDSLVTRRTSYGSAPEVAGDKPALN